MMALNTELKDERECRRALRFTPTLVRAGVGETRVRGL